MLLADDLGWQDIGCYGGPVKTPALDKLAVGGTRFSNFYSGCAVCSPSRAVLLTGRHHIRAGVYSWIHDASQNSHLLERETTLAEVLKARLNLWQTVAIEWQGSAIRWQAFATLWQALAIIRRGYFCDASAGFPPARAPSGEGPPDTPLERHATFWAVKNGQVAPLSTEVWHLSPERCRGAALQSSGYGESPLRQRVFQHPDAGSQGVGKVVDPFNVERGRSRLRRAA